MQCFRETAPLQESCIAIRKSPQKKGKRANIALCFCILKDLCFLNTQHKERSKSFLLLCCIDSVTLKNLKMAIGLFPKELAPKTSLQGPLWPSSKIFWLKHCSVCLVKNPCKFYQGIKYRKMCFIVFCHITSSQHFLVKMAINIFFLEICDVVLRSSRKFWRWGMWHLSGIKLCQFVDQCVFLFLIAACKI